MRTNSERRSEFAEALEEAAFSRHMKTTIHSKGHVAGVRRARMFTHERFSNGNDRGLVERIRWSKFIQPTSNFAFHSLANFPAVEP